MLLENILKAVQEIIGDLVVAQSASDINFKFLSFVMIVLLFLVTHNLATKLLLDSELANTRQYRVLGNPLNVFAGLAVSCQC